MEPFLILLVLVIICVVLGMPIAALAKANQAREEVAQLKARLDALVAKLAKVHARLQAFESTTPSITSAEPEPIAGAPAFVPKPAEEVRLPPPLPVFAASAAAPIAPAQSVAPPPTPEPVPPPQRPVTPPPGPKMPALNLEQFMGVKLFAWLGGLALFFGIAFFVKWSIEKESSRQPCA